MNFKQLPNMKYPRAMAAVAYLNNCFYAFGGYSGSNLNSCEKFNFSTGKWEELPNMPVARSAFNLAIQNNILYMSGDSKRLDGFDTDKSLFITCGIALPEASYSSLISYSNSLVLIQNEACWDISLENLQVKMICQIPPGKWWSCFTPYVNGSLILFARYDDGHLWVLDMPKRSIVKKYKLIS